MLCFSFPRSYAQELDSRFKKDIVRAATNEKAGNTIGLDGIMRVIHNIGADQRFSSKELKVIFDELGDGREIPINSMERIL